MSAPSLFVTIEVSRHAATLIDSRVGSSVREGVEYLLQHDLSPSNGLKPPNAVDGGSLLQKGLSFLAASPHVALDLPIGAKTIDIRKAYKKMALRYHPDKNPKTTPLFHVIQTASDRLTDPSSRKDEEFRYADQNKKNNNVPKSNSSNNAPSNSNYNPKPPTQNHYKPHTHDADNTSHHHKHPPSSSHHSAAPNYPKTSSASSAGDNNASNSKYDYKQPEPNKPYNFKTAQQNARERERVREQMKEQKKYEAEERFRHMEAKREADYKLWMEHEEKRNKEREKKAAEDAKAKKQREDILRAGERAYFEEQNRLREKQRKEQLERDNNNGHNNKTNISTAKKHTTIPSVTPDEENLHKMPDNYASSQMKNKLNNKGHRNSVDSGTEQNNKAASKPVHQYEIPKPEPSGGSKNIPSSSDNPRSYVGSTFTVGSDGNVTAHRSQNTSNRASGGGSSSGGDMKGKNVHNNANIIVPSPVDLRHISITSTTIELEWKIPYNNLSQSISVELSWRNTTFGGIEWETASMLVSGTKVLKKNLSPKSQYEFRVRCVITIGDSGMYIFSLSHIVLLL